jgi:hypothetical protein
MRYPIQNLVDDPFVCISDRTGPQIENGHASRILLVGAPSNLLEAGIQEQPRT